MVLVAPVLVLVSVLCGAGLGGAVGVVLRRWRRGLWW